MYGNNVGPGTGGLGVGGIMLPNTGGPDSIWFWIAIGCIIVGVFALLMSTGAIWRILPAGLRRSMVKDEAEASVLGR